MIMDMLGNTNWREAILRYYQESGDPQAVFRAIRASQDLEEDMTDTYAGFFYNKFFGKKRCLLDMYMVSHQITRGLFKWIIHCHSCPVGNVTFKKIRVFFKGGVSHCKYTMKYF